MALPSTITGTVICELINKGSKSEHEAALLDTGSEKYQLRRLTEDANPFYDAVLVGLIGKKIEVFGTLHGKLLLISSWKEV